MYYLFLYGLTLLLSIWATAEEKAVIRVGHFATVTHAQGVIGHGLTREQRGWFENWLGPNIDVRWYIYQTGPSAMEALFAGELDLTYVGPSPTINAYMKSKGEALRVISGACSGGSALVVLPKLISDIEDFKGKILATPQFGNTQDIAARSWLMSKGYKILLTGGDVTVLPMDNPTQLTLLQQGDLAAAWNVEPWVSRFIIEAGAHPYLDESQLWPETGGKYVTTHLVCSQKYLEKNPEIVSRWVKAHVAMTQWINDHADTAKQLFLKEFEKETGHKLSPQILERAWNSIELTYAPIRFSLFKYADLAYTLGFLNEEPNLEKLYDLRFLEEAIE